MADRGLPVYRIRKKVNVSKKTRISLLLFSSWLCMSVLPALGAGAPDAAVRTVVTGLGENRPQVVWQALPASYQNDASGLIHDFANQMEDSVWDQTFATLSKAVRVLDEKKEFVLENPQVSAQLPKSPNGEASYDGVVALLKTLLSSDLSSLERLRVFDGEHFLATTGSQLMSQMEHLAALAPEQTETLDELQTMNFRLLRSEGNRAWLLFEKPDEEPQEIEFVLVEGKWVPATMAEGWDDGIAQAREQLSQVAVDPQQMAQVGPVLAIVDMQMEGLLAAQTSEQFQASLNGILALAMMGIMGSAASQGAQGSGN